MISIREELAALNPQALLADGLDDALIGWGKHGDYKLFWLAHGWGDNRDSVVSRDALACG